MKLVPPYKFFLGISLFYGVVFLFIVPPFQVPDEANHFFRICHIVKGNVMGVKTKDMRLGGELNESIPTFTEQFRFIRYEYNSRSSLSLMQKTGDIKCGDYSPVFVDFPNNAYYSPTAYFPQVIVASVANLFVERPLILFYLVRLFSFLFWVCMIYVAIRLLPIGKWLFTFLALLPSSLFINASCSADVITNACSFLLIAMLLKAMFDNSRLVRFSDFLVVVLLTSIILLNKMIYFPLVGLCFLIPASRFKYSRNRIIWFGLLTAFCFALFIFWFNVSSSYFISYDDYHPLFRDGQQINEGVDPAAQLKGIVRYPFRFVRIMTVSLWESKLATMAHYVGKFGWEKNYIPTPLILTLLSILFFTGISATKNETSYFSLFQRTIILVIGLTMILGLASVLYMNWVSVGGERVTNLAGRYFIPILPLFFLLLPIKRDFSSFRPLFLKFACLFYVFALSWSVYSVLQRYWF